VALGSATGRARQDRSARDRASGVGQSAVCPAAALIEAAQAAVTRSKDAYCAQYERIKRRHGHNKAIVAVARSILIAAYHVLRDDVEYYEPGGNYFQRRADPTRLTWDLAAQLERLGDCGRLRSEFTEFRGAARRYDARRGARL
jgi:transposase